MRQHHIKFVTVSTSLKFDGLNNKFILMLNLSMETKENSNSNWLLKMLLTCCRFSLIYFGKLWHVFIYFLCRTIGGFSHQYSSANLDFMCLFKFTKNSIQIKVKPSSVCLSGGHESPLSTAPLPAGHDVSLSSRWNETICVRDDGEVN